jgi:hypothetical protein
LRFLRDPSSARNASSTCDIPTMNQTDVLAEIPEEATGKLIPFCSILQQLTQFCPSIFFLIILVKRNIIVTWTGQTFEQERRDGSPNFRRFVLKGIRLSKTGKVGYIPNE